MEKTGLASLLYWEKKQQEKMPVVSLDCTETELIRDITTTLKKQGYSDQVISDQVKMALSLI